MEEGIGEETPASLNMFKRKEKGKEWERDSVRKKREKRKGRKGKCDENGKNRVSKKMRKRNGVSYEGGRMLWLSGGNFQKHDQT